MVTIAMADLMSSHMHPLPPMHEYESVPGGDSYVLATTPPNC